MNFIMSGFVACLIILLVVYIKVFRQNDVYNQRWLEAGHAPAPKDIEKDDPWYKERQKEWAMKRMRLKTQNRQQMETLERIVREHDLSVRDLAVVLDSLSLAKGVHANYFEDISK